MNALHSPLEVALTLASCLLIWALISAVLVNNLWTWLAVITATLSLCRLRTIKTTASLFSLPPPPTPPPTKLTSTTRTELSKCTDIDDSIQKQEEKEGGVVLTMGNSKRVFIVYFEERENDNGDDEHDDDDEHGMIKDGDELENDSTVVMIKSWVSSSKLTVGMRGGDLGWYSCQNRKVIDGSVVRFWKEERENVCCGSPRSCRSRCTSSTTAFLLA